MLKEMFFPKLSTISLSEFKDIRYFWSIVLLFIDSATMWKALIMFLLYFASHCWNLINKKSNKFGNETYCFDFATLSKKSIAIVTGSSILIIALCFAIFF